jgi:hypothetical protein
VAHTPWPWKRDGNAIASSDGDILGWMSLPRENNLSEDENEANFCLIIAAPVMFAALQAISDWCWTEDAGQALPFEPPWAKQMQAAIAAARGEQP